MYRFYVPVLRKTCALKSIHENLSIFKSVFIIFIFCLSTLRLDTSLYIHFIKLDINSGGSSLTCVWMADGWCTHYPIRKLEALPSVTPKTSHVQADSSLHCFHLKATFSLIKLGCFQTVSIGPRPHFQGTSADGSDAVEKSWEKTCLQPCIHCILQNQHYSPGLRLTGAEAAVAVLFCRQPYLFPDMLGVVN